MNWDDERPRGKSRSAVGGNDRAEASVAGREGQGRRADSTEHRLDQPLRRTRYCGTLRAGDGGERVVLAGWVARRRDLGGLVFIDLRDRSGIVQLAFDPGRDAAAHALASKLRSEYVVLVAGTVCPRLPETRNPSLPTGDIEIRPDRLEVLNESLTPPFYITDETPADEALRLRYRYLDLRRPVLSRSFALRHRVARAVRDYLDRLGFLEIETPSLTRSTPEGARDFLVPSRSSHGSFYALPQSPQLFKQLLMVAGFDRYFQLARCYRDEDLRADRQPEFTQIDVEMSFVTEADVMALTEGLMLEVLESVGLRLVATPFRRLTYAEAVSLYGTDKPDLRFGMELRDLSAPLGAAGAPFLRRALEEGGEIRGLVVPGAAGSSRKTLEGYAAEVAPHGLSSLGAVHYGPDGLRSSLSKYLDAERLAGLGAACGAEKGDLLLLGSGPTNSVRTALGQLRLAIARQRAMAAPGELSFVWVTDFPLLEFSPEESRAVAMHHPFTAPNPADRALLATDPLAVRARAYDLVLNGVELGGGSIRNHRRAAQLEVFRALGMSEAEAGARFGFLLEALDYGAPPHGGIALGLDRMVMMLGGLGSIRDCIAFPKTTSGACPLTGAPARAEPEQLRELGLEVREQPGGSASHTGPELDRNLASARGLC